MDRLIEDSVVQEKRLEAAGLERAHEWMFALREMLYDLRRLQADLGAAFSVDPTEAPRALKRIASEVLYQILPHVQGHLAELEEDLDRTLGDTGTTESTEEEPES